MRSKLEIIFISISFIFTAFLFIIIGTLFIMPSAEGFLSAIFSNEMITSIKLTLSTSVLAAFCVILVAVPTAYSLSRYSFPLKSLVKSI